MNRLSHNLFDYFRFKKKFTIKNEWQAGDNNNDRRRKKSHHQKSNIFIFMFVSFYSYSGSFDANVSLAVFVYIHIYMFVSASNFSSLLLIETFFNIIHANIMLYFCLLLFSAALNMCRCRCVQKYYHMN